jgi:hypothetical protein
MRRVWVELPTFDGENLLFGNHYFAPDTSPNKILNYFSFLENKLDTMNYQVILMGDFNTPGFDWKCRLPLPNCYYYSTLKGEAIYTSTCLVRLTQSIEINHNNNLLDLVFVNFDNLRVSFVDMGIVKPNLLHSPVVIDIDFRVYKRMHNFEHSYRKFADRNYNKLYNIQYFQTLEYIIIYQSMLPLTVSMLLCIMLWMSLFLVVLLEKPNTLLGFLPP